MRLTVLTAALLLAAAPAAHADPANTFAVRNVRLFDGERVIAGANVVVRDGVITAAGPGATYPKDGVVIDGSGKTLIPGLIDAHVHVFPGAQADALRFGVTTELDMFDVGQDIAAWKRQRQSLERTDQADTWAAGTGVTVPGGAPIQDVPPDLKVPTLAAEADARAFVDARVAEGSDYIKLFIEDLGEYHNPARSLPTLTRGEVCAVVAAAHADHRMAVVHAQAQDAAREAIGCEADGLAHMFPDQPVTKGFIDAARAAHVFILTTDSVWAGASGLDMATRLATDPHVGPFLSDAQKSTLLAGADKPVPAFFPQALANTRALHAAGVPILAGTDAGNPATAHGVTLHQELQILVQAGFTPIEALAAATSLPDKTFALGDRGHIAPGFRADLVLIDGDPTTKISDTLAIDRIWKNGFTVKR